MHKFHVLEANLDFFTRSLWYIDWKSNCWTAQGGQLPLSRSVYPVRSPVRNIRNTDKNRKSFFIHLIYFHPSSCRSIISFYTCCFFCFLPIHNAELNGSRKIFYRLPHEDLLLTWGPTWRQICKTTVLLFSVVINFLFYTYISQYLSLMLCGASIFFIYFSFSLSNTYCYFIRRPADHAMSSSSSAIFTP